MNTVRATDGVAQPEGVIAAQLVEAAQAAGGYRGRALLETAVMDCITRISEMPAARV